MSRREENGVGQQQEGNGNDTLPLSSLTSLRNEDGTSSRGQRESNNNNNGNIFNHSNFPLPSTSSNLDSRGGRSKNSNVNSNININNTQQTKTQKHHRHNITSKFRNNPSYLASSSSSSSATTSSFSLSALTDGSVAYRNRGGGGGYKAISSSASDIVFQSKTSTQKAMRELAQRRYEAKQRRKAMFLITALLVVGASIHYVTNANYNLGVVLQNKDGVMSHVIGNSQSDEDGGAEAGAGAGAGASSGEKSDQSSESDGNGNGQQQLGEEGGEAGMDGEEEPPQEEIIPEGKEFLQPYRYFADLTTPIRKSDSNFFFHIPRSGGQTIKDIVGKCLHQTLASEVGVREGHGQDESLQLVKFNGANYVNVDTTSIQGLNRAATMGLAASGLSDMIASSYFAEVGMLFDLHHKGRAFILMRDPMVRAVSMYYYKTQGETPMIDPSVSLEDYAQGQGIENSKSYISPKNFIMYIEWFKIEIIYIIVSRFHFVKYHRLGNSISNW